MSRSRASTAKSQSNFLKSLNDSAKWFSSRVQPREQDAAQVKRQSKLRQSVRSVSFFLMLHASVRTVRDKMEKEASNEAAAAARERLKAMMEAEERAAVLVRRVVFSTTRSRWQTEMEWRSAMNTQRLKPLTDMVASLQATVVLCDEHLVTIQELEKWRKYNKRAIKHNKRDGIVVYERMDLALELILHALPQWDEGNRRKLLEQDKDDKQAFEPPAAATYRTTQSALLAVEQKQAFEYPSHLPWTARKLRRVVVEGKGDLSYKTLEDLERKIVQHRVDQAAMRKETEELNKEVEETNARVDEALIPLEDTHAEELEKLLQEREDYEVGLLEQVAVRSEALEETILAQTAEKEKLDEVKREYDANVAAKDALVAKVAEMETLLNERNKHLVVARKELEDALKQRRRVKEEAASLRMLRAQRKQVYLEAKQRLGRTRVSNPLLLIVSTFAFTSRATPPCLEPVVAHCLDQRLVLPLLP